MTALSDALFDLFKELVWDNLVNAALIELFVAFPALGWGPFGVFIRWLVHKYADKLYVASKTFLDIQRVVFKNEKLQREYDSASAKLKIIAHGNGINSDQFRSAREDAKKRLSEFVRFDIAR